jgi:hypothetical protein
MSGDENGGSTRTAMQVLVEIDKSLLQHFDVKSWNEFAAQLSKHGLLPTGWAPGERPPPVAILLDFRRLQRAHYKLTGINLSLCWLEGACFEGACLKGARLGCCPNANFRDARLQGADFSDCDVSGCCFVGAQLHDADFTGATYDPASPPTGLPPDVLAICAAEAPEQPSSTKPQQRAGERPLRATVTISEVPW